MPPEEQRLLERRRAGWHVCGMHIQENLKLTAVIEPAPEGGFTSWFEEFPEVFSEGETVAEAEVNLFDALKLVLEYHRDEARRRSVTAGAVRHQIELAQV
jgi:predicted RNase H-like HicB family nuclease